MSNGLSVEKTFTKIEEKTREALGNEEFFNEVVEANDVVPSVFSSKDENPETKINKLTSYLIRILTDRFDKYSPRYKDLDGFFGTHDRVTYSLPKEYTETRADLCRYYDFVEELLVRNGYELVDYIKGICKKDNREFKIGKILTRFTKDKDIINGFANSPVRSGNRKNLQVTVSRNLYDIITMSTFKGWTSCMNILKGSMNYKINSDLNYGTLVVYIHDEKISDMDKASGRFLLKPFFNTEDSKMVLYMMEDSSYGSVSFIQKKIGDFLVNEINKFLPRPTNDITKYSLGSGLYDDGVGQDFFYKNTDWDFTNEKHVKLIDSVELRRCSIDVEEVVKNHPDDKVLLLNPLFYCGFERKITKEDIDYLLSNDVKISVFVTGYVNRAKNPHFDKEFAFLIKDYFSSQKLFKFMLEECSLTEKLSMDDGIFSGEENSHFIEMINLRASSDFSEMRALSRTEMLILNNLHFSYELKSDALSCSYIKTVMTYKLNGELIPNGLIKLNSDTVALIEEAFSYEEQCTLITCLDPGYFWVQAYYKFLSKFLVLDFVYNHGVLGCRYFRKYCENEIPMFKEEMDFENRKYKNKYEFDTTFDETLVLALAS